MSETPDNDPNSPNSNVRNGDGDDRDTRGRFTIGNRGGPGSPMARHARELRERLNEALFKTCARDRLLTAVDAILKLAEAGDVPAMKLIMERISGPPIAADLQDRLEALEHAVAERHK